MFDYKAKLVKVIDGDTMDFELDLGFHMTTIQRVRLLGVDAPETRTKDKEEKIAGNMVKDAVTCLISPAKEIIVKTNKTGSFGRWLATVTCDGADLNKEVRRLTDEAYERVSTTSIS